MISQVLLDELVTRALLEDAANGDLTSEAVVRGETTAAVAVAKSGQVACGGFVAEAVFRKLEPDLSFEVLADEGVWLEPGRELFRVEGSARAILVGERTALNLLQRMGGVATLTKRFVDALPRGSKTRITDTRKTTPGLRALERHAVRVGGGFNHRDNLGSAVLIKDNHIALAGSVRRAVELCRAHAPHTAKLEVEVQSLPMLDEALQAGADIVMLDNFAPEEIARAVQRVGGRALVEVSGNVSVERVLALAEAGVDVISVGALTHSAPAADISLRIGPFVRER